MCYSVCRSRPHCTKSPTAFIWDDKGSDIFVNCKNIATYFIGENYCFSIISMPLRMASSFIGIR